MRAPCRQIAGRAGPRPRGYAARVTQTVPWPSVPATDLIAVTRPIADPGELLARLPAAEPLAWVRNGEGIVGSPVDEVDELEVAAVRLQHPAQLFQFGLNLFAHQRVPLQMGA